MARYKPVEPVYKFKVDEAYLQRYNKTVEAHNKVHMTYDPIWVDNRKDTVERLNVHMQQQYSDCITEKLFSVSRVLIKPGQFQFPNGEIDTKGKVRSAIVYKVLVEIQDPNAKKAGYYKIIDSDEMGAGSVLFTIGKYERPIVEPTKFDRNGNVTDAKIKEYRTTFLIEDKPETIRALYKRYGGKPERPPVVIVANLQGEGNAT